MKGGSGQPADNQTGKYKLTSFLLYLLSVAAIWVTGDVERMIVLFSKRIAVAALYLGLSIVNLLCVIKLVIVSHLEVVSLSPDHGELRQQQPIDPPAHSDEGRVHPEYGFVALEGQISHKFY